VGTQESEGVARAFFGALVAGDIEKMMSLATDDLCWTLIGSTPISGTYRGKQAVLRDFFGPVGEAIDFDAGVGLDIEEIIATGDRVIVRAQGKMQGKHGPYNNQYCHVMTIREGKVAATVEYVDTALIESALYGRSASGVNHG
jgi:ketosteroid isomerase-like protein